MKSFAPIVGMAFRPPAIKVIQVIPLGSLLELKRQPDNPFDENATRVLLPGFSANGLFSELFVECFNEALPDETTAPKGEWNQSALTDPLMLGYVGAKTGHAEHIADYMDLFEIHTLIGELISTMTGGPAVEFHHDSERLFERLALLNGE